jgi:SAM-dependent methyltransferase
LNRTIKKNFTYTGVDPYDIFLDKAKKAWRNYKNVSFKKGNIFKLPFKNGEFDIVICNNVLLHIPNLIKPIKELLRVAKRTVIIRTHIHDKSYRIQLVYNNKWWKYTNVKPKNEFDKKGNPRSFSYFDVVSEDYFKSIVLKPYPKAKIVINEDNFFNAKLINKSSKKEKRPGATKIVNGMQVSDLLILPNKIVEINK